MTAAVATETKSPSHGESVSWDELPDAEVVNLPPPPSEKEDKVPSEKPVKSGECAECGNLIVREPGSRGRLPKYCPDCKPKRGTSGTTRRTSSATRAEAEASQVVATIQGHITKLALMMSVSEALRYDAFVIMANLPQLSEQFHAVLVRYESIRKDFLNMRTGGSVIGLVITVLSIALPISAHHGLLGRGKMAAMVYELPFVLLKLQERLKEGSEALAKMMEDQLMAARKANQERAAANAA